MPSNFLTTLFRAFTGLDRIIFLDSTDLEFFSDVLLLESQFEDSWSKEAVMGVGLDLSPHYKKFLAEYIEINPETEIGKPGPRQGFNTGVVLFRWDPLLPIFTPVIKLFPIFLPAINKNTFKAKPNEVKYSIQQVPDGRPCAAASQPLHVRLRLGRPGLVHGARVLTSRTLPCNLLSVQPANVDTGNQST